MDMMSLIDTFFKTDDLKALIHQAGQMLNCPMIAIDDAFQIQASYSPENFQDDVFFAALHRGEITYEAILAISQNEQISQGKSVRMQLQDTPYPRCFAALISSEIRIGYLIYVDWKDTLSQVPESDLQMLQTILAKQLLSESSRNRILSRGNFQANPFFSSKPLRPIWHNIIRIGWQSWIWDCTGTCTLVRIRSKQS